MLPHAIFVSYILMIFIGVQGIFLVATLLKIDPAHNNRTFTANRNFILVSLGLGILYFITYYSDLVIGDFNTSFVYRLFDGMIFYAYGLSWIRVLETFSSSAGKNMAGLRKATNFVFGSLMVISSWSYGFLLDELYSASNTATNIIMIVLECLLVLVVFVFICVYLNKIKIINIDKTSRKYIIFVSVVINVINIWNSLIVFLIYIEIINVSVLSTYSYGLTSIFMMAVNSYILLYIYKTNVPAIYEKTFTDIPDESDRGSKKSPETDYNIVAEKFGLTERELEVLKLAYMGLTNPEMGEELSISKHTVKRHMHNIFKKMNVSTRLEMVHIVNGTGHE